MSQPDPNLDRVREVLDRHRQEILVRYRAVGAGIGKRRPGDAFYVISVYLASAADRPAGPVSIEGVPLQFIVTGPIRPLDQHAR